MRILYIFRGFPGQLESVVRHVAEHKARVSVFMAERWARDAHIPGVRRARIAASSAPEPVGQADESYPAALRTALKAADMFGRLRKGGFVPDVVFAAPEGGHALFVRDVFPEARFVIRAADLFAPDAGMTWQADESAETARQRLRGRVRDMFVLSALNDCAAGITPSVWQKERFGSLWQAKLHVLKPAVNTALFRPLPTGPHEVEVTYTCHGLAPTGGLELVRESAALLLARKPACRIRVVSFASARNDEARKAHRVAVAACLAPEAGRPGVAPERVDIVVSPVLSTYVRLLQTSAVQVFPAMTPPLPTGLLEAMSSGAAVLAGASGATSEVVCHGSNGWLFAPGDAEEMTSQLLEFLEQPQRLQQAGRLARETLVREHDTALITPRYAELLAGG